MVRMWFWVHKIVFLGGCRPPDPPLFLGGFQPPRPPGGGPAAPRAPLHTERLRLSGSPFFLVPRSWYQDLGTKILIPRSWYQDLWGNRSLHDGGTALSTNPNRYPFVTVRTPQASLVGEKCQTMDIDHIIFRGYFFFPFRWSKNMKLWMFASRLLKDDRQPLLLFTLGDSYLALLCLCNAAMNHCAVGSTALQTHYQPIPPCALSQTTYQ